MVLLGGAVGKWTDEYWVRQSFVRIYYLHRDFWFFNLQRGWFDAEALRIAATWYSRMVITVETGCGFLLWLMPRGSQHWLQSLSLHRSPCFSNFYLFSVLLSMIGLSAVGWFVPPRIKTKRETTPDRSNEGAEIETSISN